jgi:hypothetical protein
VAIAWVAQRRLPHQRLVLQIASMVKAAQPLLTVAVAQHITCQDPMARVRLPVVGTEASAPMAVGTAHLIQRHNLVILAQRQQPPVKEPLLDGLSSIMARTTRANPRSVAMVMRPAVSQLAD